MNVRSVPRFPLIKAPPWIRPTNHDLLAIKLFCSRRRQVWRRQNTSAGNVGGRRMGAGAILMLDRLSYNLQQVFPPEGLGEKTTCTPSHRSFAIRLSSLRGDEYNRHAIIGLDQFVLKFQA